MASEESNNKTGLQVVVRMRPLNKVEKELTAKNEQFGIAEEGGISVELQPDCLYKAVVVRDDRRNKFYSRFDDILLGNSTQEQMYQASAQKLVKDVCDGYNAGLFAYGQSGSGKSYSLIGKENSMDPNHWGLIPRTVVEFFKEAEAMRSSGNPFEGIKMKIAFFEVYQEEIYDLLKKDTDGSMYLPNGGGGSGATKISGREQRHLDRELTRLEVTETDQAVRLLQIGTDRRRKAGMPLNPVSSRSHAIYQIIIDRVYADNTRGTTSLYFADLMGSERMVEGFEDRSTESPNDELLTLGRIIQALGNESKGAVASYREKTLTYVLRDVLGGNSKCMVIVTGVLSTLQYKPTQGSLDFGDNCKGIQRVVTAPRKRLTHSEMEDRMRWYMEKIAELEHTIEVQQIEIESLKSGHYTARPDCPIEETQPDLTAEDVLELQRELKDELEKEKEFSKSILQEAQSKEELLNQRFLDEQKGRQEARAELEALEEKLSQMTAGWAEGVGSQEAGGDISSSVSTKFAHLIQEITELKQERKELRADKDATTPLLRRAEQDAREANEREAKSRAKNKLHMAEITAKDAQLKELANDLEEYRKELYEHSSHTRRLNADMAHSESMIAGLRADLDIARDEIAEKEQLEQTAFDEATRAEQERETAIRMLQELQASLNLSDTSEPWSLRRQDSVVDNLARIKTEVVAKQQQGQQLSRQLSKTVVAQQWVHAKDVGMLEKERALHLEALSLRDAKLREAQEQHGLDIAKVRHENSRLATALAEGRQHIASEKKKTTHAERKCGKLQLQIDQMQTDTALQAAGLRDETRHVRQQLAHTENELSNVTKREKQMQLTCQRLQHDTIMLDTVLAERIPPDELRKIREQVVDKLQDAFDLRSAGIEAGEDADSSMVPAASNGGTPERECDSKFNMFQKMYADALEQKATIEAKCSALEMEECAIQHELSQALSREVSLVNQNKSLERQLERHAAEMAEETEQQLALREELTQTKIRLEHKLKVAKGEYEQEHDKMQADLDKCQESQRAEVDSLSNECHIKEMKIAAMQSELEILYQASQKAQEEGHDSKFGSVVKRMIQTQRSNRAKSLGKIVEMHNSRTPNTPRLALDESTTVEDMYRDLLTENNRLKSKIAKLKQDVKSAERLPQAPTTVSSVLNSSVAPLSPELYSEILEQRKQTVSEFEKLPPSRDASPVRINTSMSDIDKYRQNLLERARIDLSSRQENLRSERVRLGGLFIKSPISSPP